MRVRPTQQVSTALRASFSKMTDGVQSAKRKLRLPHGTPGLETTTSVTDAALSLVKER